MQLEITEFDVKFSTIIANLSACIVNYSEQAGKQIKEMNGIIEKLTKENVKLVTENSRLIEKYEPVKKDVPAPKN